MARRLFGKRLNLRWRVLLCLCVSAATACVSIHPIKIWSTDHAAWVFRIVGKPATWFSELKQFWGDYEQLVQENRQLKIDVQRYTVELQTLAGIRRENEQLKKLSAHEEALGYRYQLASVLAVSQSPRQQRWLLDSGNNHSAKVGQAVVNVQGLLGQLIEVGDTSSVLMLLSDPQSTIPVVDQHTSEFYLLQGAGKSVPMQFDVVSRRSAIAVGDRLATSGLGRHYPRGIPVATVTEIKPLTTGWTRVYCEPLASTDQLAPVALISPRQSRPSRANKQPVK